MAEVERATPPEVVSPLTIRFSTLQSFDHTKSMIWLPVLVEKSTGGSPSPYAPMVTPVALVTV